MTRHASLEEVVTDSRLLDDRGPTTERLAKAGKAYDIGDDKQGTRTYTLRDAPIERLFARRGIEAIPYTALLKYRFHWYHAGLMPTVGSVDLNRVFASTDGSSPGVPKSEAQLRNNWELRNARRELDAKFTPLDRGLSGKTWRLVERIVCLEDDLPSGGNQLMAVKGRLSYAGEVLAKWWGIG